MANTNADVRADVAGPAGRALWQKKKTEQATERQYGMRLPNSSNPWAEQGEGNSDLPRTCHPATRRFRKVGLADGMVRLPQLVTGAGGSNTAGPSNPAAAPVPILAQTPPKGKPTISPNQARRQMFTHAKADDDTASSQRPDAHPVATADKERLCVKDVRVKTAGSLVAMDETFDVTMSEEEPIYQAERHCGDQDARVPTNDSLITIDLGRDHRVNEETISTGSATPRAHAVDHQRSAAAQQCLSLGSLLSMGEDLELEETFSIATFEERMAMREARVESFDSLDTVHVNAGLALGDVSPGGSGKARGKCAPLREMRVTSCGSLPSIGEELDMRPSHQESLMSVEEDLGHLDGRASLDAQRVDVNRSRSNSVSSMVTTHVNLEMVLTEFNQQILDPFRIQNGFSLQQD